MKATRKRARAKSAAKARKERSDKGISRTVTKLRNQADRLRAHLGTLSQIEVANRVSYKEARELFDGLDKLDGRMKVLIDPSKAEK